MDLKQFPELFKGRVAQQIGDEVEQTGDAKAADPLSRH